MFNSWIGWTVLVTAILATSAPVESIAEGNDPADLMILENNTVQVGIDRRKGGSITWLSWTGHTNNAVNIHDPGRLIQQSYYAGQALDRKDEGQSRAWSPWTWNPIQGGGVGSWARVTAFERTGSDTLFAETIPKLWDMPDEEAAAILRQWTSFEPAMSNVVVVRCELLARREPEDRWGAPVLRHQEIPACYFTRHFSSVKSYLGQGRWREESHPPGPPWGRANPPRQAMACFAPDGQGIAVFSPAATQPWNFGPHGQGASDDPLAGPCMHVAPLDRVALGPASIYRYRYWLVVGTADEIASRLEVLWEKYSKDQTELIEADAAASIRPAAAPAKPNIVLILADDLGIVDINAYAAWFTQAKPAEMFYETPHLDRLVREGVAFSQAYASHLCSPARVSVLTGKNAARLGFTTAVGGNVRTFYNQAMTPPPGYLAQDALEWADKSICIPQALLNGTVCVGLPAGHPLDQGRDEVTLAEALPGHRSAFIGKWHVGGHGSQGWQPSDQGFEELSYFDEGGSFYFNWRDRWNLRKPAHPKMPQPELLQGRTGPDLGHEYLTDELTEHAVRFIQQHAAPRDDQARPFFLYLCHFAVHTPFQAMPEDIAHFEGKATRGWNGHSNAVYAGMLKRLDDSIGRILQTLEVTGLETNTLVVFLSDNGGVTYTDPMATWNAPFKGGKAMHFEGGIRVPLVFRWKGRLPEAQWCHVPVECSDLFPTLLELAGYDPAPFYTWEMIDGRSLAPLFTDLTNRKKHYARDTFIWHYPLNVIVKNPDDGQPLAPHSTIRQGDWKLVFDWSGVLKLYNIAKDPFERRELSAAQPKRTQALFRQLNDWLDANVELKYFPALNPDYDPATEVRDRPFVDLRRKYLGEARAIRPAGSDPRFAILKELEARQP